MARASGRDGPVNPPSLRRVLGRWDLTAIGINQVIGGAIFLMPSRVADEVGAWAPIAFVAAGVASMLVALCFAEVGSRFDRTGGPYLATRAAFGEFAAFEVGWMQWFTRASSLGAVSNGIALAIGFYWAGARDGAGRALCVTAVVAVLAAINARGIEPSKWTVNALTIGKLVPLALFVAAGLWFVRWDRFVPLPEVSAGHAATAGLLLYFVYGGFDVISVPAAEARDPRRDIPFAFIGTIVVVGTVMTLTQVVATGTLDDIAQSSTPLADAAMRFLGPAGAALIGLGSLLAMMGNCTGHVLTGSRMLFAMAENRALPAWFGIVHPVWRTPVAAVAFTSAVGWVLGLTGSFATLALVATVARLVTYTGTCASTLALRWRPRDSVPAAKFTVPCGAAVPLLAIAVSLATLFGATRGQLLGGGAALAGGAVLWAVARRTRRGDAA
jgi:basic amino acid/polyamine antiporter, APA family